MFQQDGTGRLSWYWDLQIIMKALIYLRLLALWLNFILGDHCFQELQKPISSLE